MSGISTPVEIGIDGQLTLNEKGMEKYKEYRFKFLEVDMVAIKGDFGIELFQEIDYLNLKDDMERGTR